MSDFPSVQTIGPVISTDSIYSMGGVMVAHTVNGPGSAGFGLANTSVFVPFRLSSVFALRSMFLVNGTSVTGNIDLGVYKQDGTLIVSKGSTAQAGVSDLQILSLTETLLAPGPYYMAVGLSSGSATVSRHSYGTAGQQVAGIVRATMFPLSNLPTFASHAGAVVPIFGIASITSY